MKKGLRSSRLRMSEEVDPLQGVVNIVDAMLVFACGLMLSLVIHWNVDLGKTGQEVGLQPGKEMALTSDIIDKLNETKEGGKQYEKMGTVYKDPITGKLFMLTDK